MSRLILLLVAAMIILAVTATAAIAHHNSGHSFGQCNKKVGPDHKQKATVCVKIN